MHWLPRIQSCQFPNLVQGVGQLTPLLIRVSSWGVLQVCAIDNPNFVPYQKMLTCKACELKLNVPKGQRIQIRVWNLFGWSTVCIASPTNNTPVSGVEPTRPIRKYMPAPGFSLPKLSPNVPGGQNLRDQLSTLVLNARLTGHGIRAQIMGFQAPVTVPRRQLRDYRHGSSPNFRCHVHSNALKAPKENFDLLERKLR